MKTGKQHISDEELLAGQETKPENTLNISAGNAEPASPIAFEIQSAPDGIFEQRKKGHLDAVLNKLGVTQQREAASALKTEFLFPENAQLSTKQIKWCEEAYPFAMMLAGGCFQIWLLFGPEYAVLIPDKDVLYKIVAPLVRIYARTVKKLEIINPNYTDATASLMALVGYASSSWYMLQQIWQMKREGIDARDNDESARAEDIPVATDAGSHDHGRAHDPTDVRRKSIHEPGQLTAEQQFQFQQLARLRNIDRATRMRQLGLNG